MPASRPRLDLSGFNKDVFQDLICETFSTNLWNFVDGADAYSSWYEKVLMCCMRAGARRLDGRGRVHRFDFRSNMVVEYKKKPLKVHGRAPNKPWWAINARRQF